MKSTWALIMIGLNVVVVYGAVATPLTPSIDGLSLLQPLLALDFIAFSYQGR